MNTRLLQPSKPRTGRGAAAAALVLVVAGTAGFVALTRDDDSRDPVRPGPSSTGATSSVADPAARPAAPVHDRGREKQRGSTTSADGAVHGTVTVFDDDPAVTNLDPALLDALQRAATAAREHGFELRVNSGWRSAAYQAQLLREAAAKYGSEEEAARWVATPTTSLHVTGDAVDLGPTAAVDWLAHHGAAYGLCPVYRNEPWHYELHPEAASDGCPELYADPTRDPRMSQ